MKENLSNNLVFDKCIIIHGCPSSETSVMPHNQRWMNWLADQLTAKGWDAVAPDMPKPWRPDYQTWKQKFEKYPVTNRSLLVGHSCGAAFLVRWLLDTKTTVKKLVLVAPAKIPEGNIDKRNPMYEFDLPANASSIANEVVIFTSNDFAHHLKALEIYKEAFATAKIMTLENKGHFLLYFTTGSNEFPELLAEILQSK